MDIEVSSDQTEFEFTKIKRIAAIVAKEEPILQLLKLIRRHNLIIPKDQLLQIKTAPSFRHAIDQAIYYGLLSQIVVENELENGLFYHLTEKGCKVLDTCGRRL